MTTERSTLCGYLCSLFLFCRCSIFIHTRCSNYILITGWLYVRSYPKRGSSSHEIGGLEGLFFFGTKFGYLLMRKGGSLLTQMISNPKRPPLLIKLYSIQDTATRIRSSSFKSGFAGWIAQLFGQTDWSVFVKFLHTDKKNWPNTNILVLKIYRESNDWICGEAKYLFWPHWVSVGHLLDSRQIRGKQFVCGWASKNRFGRFKIS